jgi:1-acyl-sn-glycerol-3-phosphate acyltransferase
MKSLRAAWRLLRVLVHLLSGAWTIRREFGVMDFEQRQQRVQAWSRRLLDLMGVRLLVSGELPAAGPLLVLANHISWLDIIVIDAVLPCRFVSKADVRHWPLIGGLVEGSGTLFIERDRRRDAMRVVHLMAERLQAGDRLGVFPEGTTSDGRSLLPFHANLLQAAVATDSPVLLLGLRYTDARDGRRHDGPTYVGDTSLLGSLWSTLGASGLQAELHVGEPDTAQGRDRRTWADALRRELARRLDLPLPG